jgi:hypothetical protein
MTDSLIVDDRSQGGFLSNLGTPWRAITDQVMGGVSTGNLEATVLQARPCLLLTGQTRLENNGGFVQAAADLATNGYLDASAFAGIELDVLGDGTPYNIHLRTTDTRQVWQSYRCRFNTTPDWQTVRLTFNTFQPHRLATALDTRQLRRIGIVSIGSAGNVYIAFSRIAFFNNLLYKNELTI